MIQKHDWKALEAEFMQGELSLKEFAKKKGISYSYLRVVGSNWLWDRKEARWIGKRVRYLETDSTYQQYRKIAELQFNTAFQAQEEILNRIKSQQVPMKELIDVAKAAQQMSKQTLEYGKQLQDLDAKRIAQKEASGIRYFECVDPCKPWVPPDKQGLF